MGWVGRVLTDHTAMGWLSWKGSYRSQSHGTVGLDGSLQITEPQDGWVGKVLKDHKRTKWLGWKDPYRSQSHGIVGLDGSLQITEPQDGWVGPWGGWVELGWDGL